MVQQNTIKESLKAKKFKMARKIIYKINILNKNCMFTAAETLGRAPGPYCLFCEGHSLKVYPFPPQAKDFSETK